MEPELELRIQERAYELWDRDGRPDGRANEHWLMAELELRGITSVQCPSPMPSRSRKAVAMRASGPRKKSS